MSRIQVLDVPIVAPGVCVLCGTAGGDSRKFVDFGKQVDWYGAVYFCTECLGEVARSIGYLPVAEFDELHTAYRELQVKHDTVEAKYSGVTSALDTLFANYDRGIESANDFVDRNSSPVEKSEFSEGLDKEFDIREPEASESDSVEGPDDIFDDSDFE